MAYTTLAAPAPLPRLAFPFKILFGALGDSLSRARQITALSELTDDELTARGLRRGDIARFVAHDDYWR
ncbi:DUF1127 domain-containing protein [Antarcticimicrobium luteum]|uniref:DUF1127 domain-containing protein n=1 Tax=Antarcticimicrobium luteum TaxID=2547397 RepID=A0A4R5UXG2_9RHOB|nr:DUF1127 domain-containing protein [Antarcticimicrobium luteum]TDK43815.1 DUF1127 domain-containing protein [Antarcticimicrobium luteum]